MSIIVTKFEFRFHFVDADHRGCPKDLKVTNEGKFYSFIY